MQQLIERAFQASDLVGGSAVLDFVNTVSARESAPRDSLFNYSRLLEWAALAGVFPTAILASLRKQAKANPQLAEKSLASGRRLREALFAVFRELAEGRPLPREALHILETFWKQAVRSSALSGRGTAAVPAIEPNEAGLDFISLELAVEAVRLLSDPPAKRIRICGGTDCGWLFIDSSKGGRRRWCDMAVCGNVAKARRHYRKTNAGKPRSRAK